MNNSIQQFYEMKSLKNKLHDNDKEKIDIAGHGIVQKGIH
jgi:hypothetical protein